MSKKMAILHNVYSKLVPYKQAPFNIRLICILDPFVAYPGFRLLTFSRHELIVPSLDKCHDPCILRHMCEHTATWGTRKTSLFVISETLLASATIIRILV